MGEENVEEGIRDGGGNSYTYKSVSQKMQKKREV